MIIIHNRFIPFGRYLAINLFGIIFVRRGRGDLSPVDRNHEYIHTLQQRELLFVFFYLFYVTEWVIRLLICRNAHEAYRNISFEREAYTHQRNQHFPQERRLFAWVRFIK